MSAPLISDWHRLSFQFSVQFAWRDSGMHVSWAPRPPRRHEMQRVLAAYRTARDLFLSQVEAAIGVRVAVSEVPL